jgi:hypothetical protein
MKDEKKISGYQSSFVGMGFFLSKPKLWLIPLLSAFLAWLLLFFVFIIVAYQLWPHHESAHLKYTLKAFQALGIGAIAALVLWVFFIPFFLNLCFEQLLKKVYLAKGDVLAPLSFFSSISSSAYILFKTFGWRIFWIVLGGLMIIASAPLALIIAQLGIAHIALLDGCDLSLSLKGIESKKKWALIKHYRLGILSGGCVAGLVSVLVMPTILVWLFWIPAIYIGACLWVRQWDV